MFRFITHFDAGFFATGTHIKPSPDNISKLLEAFDDKQFVPNTVQAIHIGPKETRRLQLELMSEDMSWLIEFEHNRYLIRRRNLPYVEMCSPSHFISESKEILRRILGLFPVKGTRLSFTTKGLLENMPSKKLRSIHGKLFKLPEFFQSNPPSEWTTRNVSRIEKNINDKEEQINVIMDINRKQGTYTDNDETIEFDCIEVGYDINTHQENNIQRFNEDDMSEFLDLALDTYSFLNKEFKEFIDE